MKNLFANRYNYAKLLAAVATVAGILFLVTIDSNIPEFLKTIVGFIWLVTTPAAYICGGFWQAVKMSLNIGKWGWLVVPFPYDILTFIVASVVALAVFLFVPIIPVNKAAKENS